MLFDDPIRLAPARWAESSATLLAEFEIARARELCPSPLEAHRPLLGINLKKKKPGLDLSRPGSRKHNKGVSRSNE